MKDTFKTIQFYAPEHEPALIRIEKEAAQGKLVKLEMERDSFLSRSTVFDNWQIAVALNEGNVPIGAIGGTIIPFQVGEKVWTTGMYYDARMSEAYRKKGIGGRLVLFMKENYFSKNGVNHLITTAKVGNVPITKGSKILQADCKIYLFEYLTIPTSVRLKQFKPTQEACLFLPTLFDQRDSASYIDLENGMKIWPTYDMYTLKIGHIHPLAKMGLTLAGIVNKGYRQYRQGTTLNFATLFDYAYDALKSINETLAYLESKQIGYLNICCKKGDPVYRLLQPISISRYPYFIISTFDFDENEKVAIDVRCL